MRRVIATLNVFLALFSVVQCFSGDGEMLEHILSHEELLEALNITDTIEEQQFLHIITPQPPLSPQQLTTDMSNESSNLVNEHEDFQLIINGPDPNKITEIPYRRCGNIKNRHFMARMLNTECVESVECMKDSFKMSIQEQTCGVFPACTVGWDNENDVPTVICHKWKVYLISAVTFLFSLVIVLANLLIIVVICRTKSLRTPQGLFKLSLAFSALLLGAFYLPSSAYYMLHNIFYDERDRLLIFGHIAPDHDCQLNNIMNMSQLSESHKDQVRSLVSPSHFLTIISIIQSIVTVYSLFLLAFDRFLSVRWPVKYRVGEIMTKKRATSLIFLVWTLAIAISMVMIFSSGGLFYASRLLSSFTDVLAVNEASTSNATESITDNSTITVEASFLQQYWHGILVATLVWLVPFLATWVFTIALMTRSHTMLNRMRHSRRSCKGGRSLNSVDRSLMMTVVVMLSLFTATTLPLFVVLIDTMVNYDEDNRCFRPVTVYGMFAAFYLHTLGSFFNLLIYNIFQKDFRQSAAKVFGMPCLDPMARADASIRRGRKTASTSSSTSGKRTLSSTISNTIASGITSLKRGKSSSSKKSSTSDDNGGHKLAQLPAARVSSDASTSTKSSGISLDSA